MLAAWATVIRRGGGEAVDHDIVVSWIAVAGAPDTRKVMQGTRLTTTWPDGATEAQTLTSAEAVTVLRDDFGARLEPWEMLELKGFLEAESI